MRAPDVLRVAWKVFPYALAVITCGTFGIMAAVTYWAQ